MILKGQNFHLVDGNIIQTHDTQFAIREWKIEMTTKQKLFIAGNSQKILR